MGPEREVTLDAKGVRLCVATPTHDGRLHAAHATSVEEIAAWARSLGVRSHRIVVSGSQLARLRCELAFRALADGATHLLFLDEDIAFANAPRAMAQLLGTMQHAEADLVSAACMVRPCLGTSSGRGLMSLTVPAAQAGLRSEPMRWASSVTRRGETVGLAPQRAERPLMPGPEEALLLGCGALLIDCRAFGRFRADEPPFRFADGLGEDHWFSREVQRRGGRAAIDPRVATVHYGYTGWMWEGQ